MQFWSDYIALISLISIRSAASIRGISTTILNNFSSAEMYSKSFLWQTTFEKKTMSNCVNQHSVNRWLNTVTFVCHGICYASVFIDTVGIIFLGFASVQSAARLPDKFSGIRGNAGREWSEVWFADVSSTLLELIRLLKWGILGVSGLSLENAWKEF